jgi:S-adenosylmethionine:tRNA ribosyltransferase-isomerase
MSLVAATGSDIGTGRPFVGSKRVDPTLRAPLSQLDFDLPPSRSATAPPEARGVPRDQIRLLVARPDAITQGSFRALPEHLRAGDLVVVNTSATMPAALDGRRSDGRPVVVHISGRYPDGDGTWVVELRRIEGTGPTRAAAINEVLILPGMARLTILSAYPDPQTTRGSRLWRARLDGAFAMGELLDAHGRPITYDYVTGHWPLATYQPVFAHVPGSAEMASAGRPFTTELIAELVAKGVTVAPITLHAGVSSLEAGELPQPEPFSVPAHTARLVELTRRSGGRVVAVGTTVTRALETIADTDGTVRAGEGWTELVLGPDRPARVVTGLVTGWHAPRASHLGLLEAVAGPALVRRAYAAALAGDVLWHEFGDSCLFLP